MKTTYAIKRAFITGWAYFCGFSDRGGYGTPSWHTSPLEAEEYETQEAAEKYLTRKYDDDTGNYILEDGMYKIEPVTRLESPE